MLRCLGALTVVIVAAGCKLAHGAVESRTQLVGKATIDGVYLSGDVRGHVRMIIRGTGDISDDCPDAGRRVFLSELDGDVMIAPDGSFAADLYPFSPPVATPSGCTVEHVTIERIDGVTISIGVPSLGVEGSGWLDFQTLSSVDSDELQRGNYGTLHTSLYLPPLKPQVLF